MGELDARHVDSLPTSSSSRTSVTIGSSLIPIINKLQDILAQAGSELDVSLPQVAVVGSQSSGKSSVLEALVGRDFLPRGCDICTRRPLVLMLENRLPKPGDDRTEWGEFRHLPEKRFYDFSEIRAEIQARLEKFSLRFLTMLLAETEREAGLNKGVSDKQIRLKITSPNVLNMTLVDLPGITKVPVGDQPNDIEARIRKMVMTHISQQNCIILAVTPANSDLATSDALQMAREADPTGFRTIGVITKLDIMDRGTDARSFLLGKVIPLKLGYVGVVNRSQEDINKNCGIATALAYEDKFFNDHPVYRGLSDHCGIPQLARKLNEILEQHIRMVFPALKADLNSKMGTVLKELQTYGKPIESKMEQGVILLNILTQYCEAFAAMVDGKSQEMSTKELSGGARIHYILQSIFVKCLEEVDPCDDLTDDDIRMAIQNASGARNALFVPEVPFEFLVRRQIARLLDPSLQCLQFVYDELMKISHACEVTELQRFPVLRKHLDEVMVKFLRDGVEPAERMIGNLIEMEGVTDAKGQTSQTSQTSQTAQTIRSGLLNGLLPNQGSRPQPNNENHVSSGTKAWIPSLFGSRTSAGESMACRPFGEPSHSESMPSIIHLREPPSSLRPVQMTENKAVEIIVTKLLLRSYYDIVRKNIQDLVPKAIMHFLVNLTKRNLHRTFIQKLYRENLFEELLHEHDALVSQRKRNQELFKVLEQSVQALEKVDFDVSSQTSSLGTDASIGLPRIPMTSAHLHMTAGGEIAQVSYRPFPMPTMTKSTA
ncbi:hypothetical protein ACE6H2_004023 [Prunus campanulata]